MNKSDVRVAGDFFNDLLSYIHYVKRVYPTHDKCFVCVSEWLYNDTQIEMLKTMIENNKMKYKEHTEMDKKYFTIIW